MRNLAVAEWLLSRFTTSSRAGSIVGDLLEDSTGRRRVSFWLSVATVLLSLVWRHLVALGAALAVGLLAFDFLHNLAYSVYAVHLPVHQWKVMFDLTCLSSTLLSFGVPYSAIRYGLKNEFTQQTIVTWALASIVTAYWWVPFVTAACGLLAACSLLCSVLSAERRRALMASVAGLGLGVATYLAFGWYALEQLAHSSRPVLGRLAFPIFALGLVLQPVIYSRIHALFWRDGPKTEPS